MMGEKAEETKPAVHLLECCPRDSDGSKLWNGDPCGLPTENRICPSLESQKVKTSPHLQLQNWPHIDGEPKLTKSYKNTQRRHCPRLIQVGDSWKSKPHNGLNMFFSVNHQCNSLQHPTTLFDRRFPPPWNPRKPTK